MARLALSGGFYVARSLIANAQRCVNLYPERNPADAPTPYTHYPTPGLVLRSAGRDGLPVRGVFRATNGELFCVEGSKFYYVDAEWNRYLLFEFANSRTTPVSMQDNGSVLLVVDGSSQGWAVNLATHASGLVTSVNFLGADFVKYVDTFFVLNQPGTRNFYWSLSNVTYSDLTGGSGFDGLDIAGKVGYPDFLASLIIMHAEIWLLGAQASTEVWYDAGADSQFQRVAGVFIEQGCIAPYSVAKNDLAIFWLGVNASGERTVFMGSGYQAKRISTPGLAATLASYASVSDAIGMTYTQEDHVFYLLTFPSANHTWVYDVSEGLWHERAWNDPESGEENRHRANCMTLAYGEIVVGDHSNGNLYSFDLDTYTDNGAAIVRRRGFPHVVGELGTLVEHLVFNLDLEGGWTTSDEPGDYTIMLHWSDDRGVTWGTPVELSLGAMGEYGHWQATYGLGVARDRVYEVFWSAPTKTALQGAWIATKEGGN